MIAAAPLLVMLQGVQTLPPVYADPISPASFSCDLLDPAGNSFALSGEFPAYPARWDPNSGMVMKLDSTGPAELRGRHMAKPFAVGPDYRRYYITAEVPGKGHYNLMFVLFADDTGLVTVNRFTRDPQTGRGAMNAVANGSCNSTFGPVKKGGAGK